MPLVALIEAPFGPAPKRARASTTGRWSRATVRAWHRRLLLRCPQAGAGVGALVPAAWLLAGSRSEQNLRGIARGRTYFRSHRCRALDDGVALVGNGLGLPSRFVRVRQRGELLSEPVRVESQIGQRGRGWVVY